MPASHQAFIAVLALAVILSCNALIPAATAPSASPTAALALAPAPSPTPRVNRTTQGRIQSDEIWRGEILVTGDITVPQGVTLRIEPGTAVRFTAQRDALHGGGNQDEAIPERKYFPNDPPAIPANMIAIFVLEGGSLLAQGTDAAPITFTSDSSTPRVNDWQGLDVTGEARLDHVILEYAYWAVQVRPASRFAVRNTTFQHIATCAICPGFEPNGAELVISENTFIDCGHEGVDSHGGQNIVVRGNRFLRNVVGVIANDGSTIAIEGNYFEGNRTGISINYQGNPTIVGNEITSSTLFGIWLWEGSSAGIRGNNIHDNATNLGLGRSPGNLVAEDNWWGTSNADAIGRSIHDGKDEAGLGVVDFIPFSPSPFDLVVPG